MKNFWFAILFISCTYPVAAQDVTLDWSKAFGNSFDDYGVSIVADTAGNVYTLGSTGNSTDFGPGPGMVPIYGGGIFITKHDKNGNLLWVKTIKDEGPGNSLLSIALDKKGNIYYGGVFTGTADFDPGAGIFNLTATLYGQSAFVSKLDANGNFLWAAKIDNTTISAIAIDPSGNVYSTGSFYGVADFDPGPGTFNLSEIGFDGVSAGPLDIFVLKLDTNGKFIWAVSMGGTSSDEGKAITADNYGNVVITGYFEKSANLATRGSFFNVNSSGGNDAFYVKLSSDGNFVCGGEMGGPSEDIGTSVCTDASGNIYLSGDFYGPADMEPWVGVFNLSGNPFATSVYVIKEDAYGNFIWAKQFGGTGSAHSLGMSMDSFGNLYLTGSFEGVTDFDPGAGVSDITANGADIYISKLNKNGNFIWAKSMGAENEDVGRSIFVDASRNIYTTGWFWGTVDFDPEAGVYNLSSNGLADVFVQKLSQCHITFDTINVTTCNSYTLNTKQFVTSGTYTQRLTNSVGCDSIITLNLLLTGSRDTVNITSCGSYFWQNHLYSATGIYKDTLKNPSGCDSILNLVLTVNNGSADTVVASICEGGNYAGYTFTGTYKDTLVSANGCDSIRTLFLTVKKRPVSTISAAICEGGNYDGYTVTGNYTDTLTAANGCDSIRMLQLLVHPKKYTLEDINICEGDSYFAGGANQFSSGVYADTLHTTFGCDSIVTTNLTVNANPKPNLGGDRSLCTGQPVIINPGVFKSYLWQDGTTGPTISINNTGEYWVKVTGDNNCTANDSLNIFSLLPSPTDFLDPADSICSYEKLSIGANKSYPDYQWSTGSRESHINIENAGVYSLTVTDVNGCSGMESITIYPKNCIKGFYIPNAFTPNNDGNNDIFKPMIFGNVITYSFVVYNRWGQKVFESNDLLKGWDGTFRGENPQADIFVWTCTYQFEGGNLENKKGTVMLVR